MAPASNAHVLLRKASGEGVSWLRIDDGFCENEKVEGLSHQAFRLHVAALCLCARLLTDGRITDTNLRKLGAGIRVIPRRYVEELVTARLWSVHPRGGWKIKDYLDYNPSSVRVKEQRQRNADRQARHRVIHRNNGDSNGVTNAAPSPTPINTKNYTDLTAKDLGSEEALADVKELLERLGGSFGEVKP